MWELCLQTLDNTLRNYDKKCVALPQASPRYNAVYLVGVIHVHAVLFSSYLRYVYITYTQLIRSTKTTLKLTSISIYILVPEGVR